MVKQICWVVPLFWAINASAQTADPVKDSSSSFEEDASEKPRRSTPAVALRAGTYAGNGASTMHCSGSDCVEESTEVPYDDVATPVFAADVLFNVDSKLRLGGSLGVVPWMKIHDREGDSEMGVLVSFGAPVEMFVDLGPNTAFVLRAQLDALVLAPGGDLEQAATDIADQCGSQCKVDGGPYFGMAGGIGAGLMADTGTTRLRADLMFQGYSIKTLHTEFRTVDANIDLTFAGVKLVAMAGIEL